MKKMYMMSFVLSLALILAACNQGKTEVKENLGFEHTERIEVLSAEGLGSAIHVIEKQDDMEEFIDELNVEAWRAADEAPNALQENMFTMYQMGTVNLGESTNDKRDLKEVASIITYKNSRYIDLKTNHFTLHFKVPKKVAQSLANRSN